MFEKLKVVTAVEDHSKMWRVGGHSLVGVIEVRHAVTVVRATIPSALEPVEVSLLENGWCK